MGHLFVILQQQIDNSAMLKRISYNAIDRTLKNISETVNNLNLINSNLLTLANNKIKMLASQKFLLLQITPNYLSASVKYIDLNNTNNNFQLKSHMLVFLFYNKEKNL